MIFADFLRAEVLRLGDGVAQRGEILAAIACSGLRPMSPRTIRRLVEGETLPTKAEEVGMRTILPQCGPISARDGRLKGKSKKP